MVLTRSQARARAQQGVNHNANQTPVTTGSTTRKRTTTMTPKARATTPAAGRHKAKPKGGSKPPQPTALTPERTLTRAWPETPRAPRKSDAPVLKPDFPTHFASSPYPSTYGTPLVMSMDDIDDSRFRTSTQHPSQRVRFDVENLTLIPPPIGDDLSSNASTIVSSELPQQYLPQFRFPSSRDIVESIPGNWVRSPGECSQRLALVVEDTSAHGERERELVDQARVNQIFQQEYDRMMNDQEGRQEEKFVRKHRVLKRENAMIL
ncbi:hypothetical protein PM082_018082 [Marasmius tenuissimus]|nr:hypothetical protein PM082_018082 [Marasmius tenuissimus]